MGRPYVKRYMEERELVVMLPSGHERLRESSVQPKTARKISPPKSLLFWHSTPSGIMTKSGPFYLPTGLKKYIPPKKGASHVWRVIKEFYAYEPQYAGTDIKAAVDYLGKGMPQEKPFPF